MGGRHAGERLTAADASNVVIDARDQVNVFLLAGVLGVGGFVGADGALDLGQLRHDLSLRLRDPARPELSRLSERVVDRQGTLVWERCEPDLTWHVRLADPVAGLDGLAAACSAVMTVGLPAERPAWELLVVPGVADAAPGVVFRAHHSIADGTAAVRLAELLFGGSAPAPPAAPPPRHGSRPRRSTWRTVWTGAIRVAAMFRRAVPPTVLLGPIGTRRGVGFAATDLASLAHAARRSGGTVNDALLAAVAAAVTAGLRAAGQPVPGVLPVSVPVALPDRAGSGNAVGVMVVELPTGEPDVAKRIATIAASTRAAKEEARAAGTFELTRSRWGSRLFAWLARRQRFIVAFVTNVRGPDVPLAIGGAPLEEAWPVTPIQGNVRLGVSALSYRGRLACAVHADPAAVDAAVVARVLVDELSRPESAGA